LPIFSFIFDCTFECDCGYEFPAAAEKKEEKKEEVEEVDMGNLFGGDDDGY
jgi:hypothetical protein